ncbi:MAG: citrate synthase, partial [Clostridiales bacterium]|nr:citrate synthase [Clostridiales bacterium]
VSSSGTDTYSAIAAAIGSLKGPKHGGANIKVIGMMEEIKKNVSDWTDREEVERYLLKLLKKEAYDKSGLIYGMGHAVYTVSDPRAVLLREKAGELAQISGNMEEFNLYRLIEELSPDVFAKFKNSGKDMCANVDFYSGFVYNMLNIPQELFTPIFAISRISGWCAHRIEELINGNRIIRPAYKSVCHRMDYIPISKR